jgi:hypothetical protein
MPELCSGTYLRVFLCVCLLPAAFKSIAHLDSGVATGWRGSSAELKQ